MSGMFAVTGSPPLARGVLLISVLSTAQVRITPACAGSTGVNLFNDARRKDHPRLRGEYIFGIFAIPDRLGSPPLARGVQIRNEGDGAKLRITPACAGSTENFYLLICFARDHPRLRGEYR